MWWLLPAAQSILSGQSQAQEAQRQHDLNTVRAGTGMSFQPAAQPDAWATIGQGVIGGLATQQQMEMQDVLKEALANKYGVNKLAEDTTWKSPEPVSPWDYMDMQR